MKMMADSQKKFTFAVEKCGNVATGPFFSYDLHRVGIILGLTGFDGEMKWYVSTRSWAMGGSLISSVGKLIGNNEYALAA